MSGRRIISVIMRVFKVASFLREAMEGILAQRPALFGVLWTFGRPEETRSGLSSAAEAEAVPDCSPTGQETAQFPNVKRRSFDIPAVGGGAYITTYNPDLALHYEVNSEILCWHSYDDLVEQVRWLLDRPQVCRELARAARERCLREHRWVHRYQAVLAYLGVMNPASDGGTPMFEAGRREQE